MGKKIKHNKKQNDKEEDDAKEEIAVLEEGKEKYDESEKEQINEIEILGEKESNLHKDFSKYFTAKEKKITWLETLDTTSSTPIDQKLNTDDDIKRELFFYNIAKENAIKGMKTLKDLKEKINRPGDFFVEMLKSDEQMANVKKGIIKEQHFIKKFEEKKQKMQNIKFAKSLKDFQNKEKSSFKRRTMEGIQKWKEHIKKNPNDYNDIDKFFDGKKKKKYDIKDNGGKNGFKSKQSQSRYNRKKQMKRPGKIKRMMNRNKKNSKKINKD